MLAKDEIQTGLIPSDFRFDSAIMQDTAQLNQTSFPLLTSNPGTVNIRKTIGDPGKEQASQLSIRDATHHLLPERQGQVGVILPQPLVGLDAGLIAVSWTTPCSVLGLTLHQSGS